MKTFLHPTKLLELLNKGYGETVAFFSRVNLSYSEVQDRVMVRIKFAIIPLFLCLLKFIIFIRSGDYGMDL